MKEIVFFILALFHILIWVFVLFAFLNKKTAYINLYFVVPFIYLLHILPIHIIESTKEGMYPDTWKDKQEEIMDELIFPRIFKNIQSFFDFSFYNPISTQGMLIFGLISCAYVLYPPWKIKMP